VPLWVGQSLSYRTRARPKRSFHTVLDAADLVVDGEVTRVALEGGADGGVTLSVDVPLRGGRIDDRVVMARTAGAGLSVQRLERRVITTEGATSRHELVDFASSTHELPACTYVEVSTPFLLGAQPFDGKLRSLYAWICDRFVAKVYYESRGVSRIAVPAGQIEAREVIMYPDLNDWVKLPSIITKLSKPFLPKYHMWYEAEAPHKLVRFEGPYGPPGAPEILLELDAP
jgi:hypothetical protein